LAAKKSLGLFADQGTARQFNGAIKNLATGESKALGKIGSYGRRGFDGSPKC
jgi:hypothetical protein